MGVVQIPALSFVNVSKEYVSTDSKKVMALSDVSFTVDRGEFFVILGESGGGKTTLLNLTAGFEAPTSGVVLMDGKPVLNPGWERVVVFQEHGLFPWMTAAENIAFGLKMKNVPKNEQKVIVRQYISMIGLEGFEDKYPKELSGGMKQRVGIARALAVDSEMVIMDEPLGALDAQTRSQMQDELLQIMHSDKKRTVIFVTHSIEEALKLADVILVLTPRPGRVKEIFRIERERPRHVLTDPLMIELNVKLHQLLHRGGDADAAIG